MFDEIWLIFFLDITAPRQRRLARRVTISSKAFERVFSTKYLLAKFGFDTAKNEPLKICQTLARRSKLEKT